MILIYTSRNKQELLIKKHLLESNGIPAEVKLAPEERHTRGWGMPVGMEDLEKLFHLSVPWEAADEAKKILEAAAGPEAPRGKAARETGAPELEEHPALVLLDPDHRVLVGPEGLPLDAVDEAADPKPFRYLFSYACRAAGAHVYQVFLSNRPAERVRKIAEGFSWYDLKAVLEGARSGVVAADFREMYVEGFLSGFDPPEPVFSAERFGGTPPARGSASKAYPGREEDRRREP